MPADTPRAVAIVLSLNDLEAVAIAALARREGAAVIDLGLPWGGRPDVGDPRLAPERLPPTVILVELPSPDLEDALRRAGKRVVVIDHHQYAGPAAGGTLDRRSPLSSLEQVAALLGAGPLDEEQRLTAANDRGFWPELLAAAGGGAQAVERVRAIRRADLATRIDDPAKTLDAARLWLDGAEARGDLTVLPVRRARAGGGEGGLTLLTAPAALAPVLMDALYERRLEACPSDATPLEVLAVYTGPDGRTVSVAVSAGAGRRALLESVIAWAAAQDGRLGRLRLWTGGGDVTAYLGAVSGPDAVEGARALDALADRLVEELLDGNRPLRRWRTQFLAMLSLPDGASAEPTGAGAAAAPAAADQRVYWLPHLRPLLAPADPAEGPPAALRCWRIRAGVLALRVRRDGRTALVLPVSELVLHLGPGGPGGLCAVEWTVEGAVAEAETAGSFGWRAALALGQAVAEQAADQPATVAELLDAMELVRPLYAPFAGDFARRDIDLLRDGACVGTLAYGAAVSEEATVPTGWFAALAGLALAPFGVAASDTRLLHDERARVVTALVPVGEGPLLAPGRAAGRVIAARLSGVDAYGSAHAYSPAFAEGELERASYDRFADFGTRYLVSDHSLALLGYGWFPAHVAAGHLATLYRWMFLVVLWRAAVAACLCAAAADAVIGTDDASRSRLSNLRRAARAFRATFGGGPVTGQMQGAELFALMLRQSGADAALAAALAVAEDAMGEAP